MSEVALVTGASRGIGAAIAHALAEQGLFVIGTATTASGAEKINTSLNGKGRGLIMDVGRPESVVTAMESLDSEEAPAVLVNNAGITNDNLMLRMSEDEWTRVIDVNVNGLYRVTKTVLRGMIRKRWGRIVNVGSTVGRMGNPGQANYVASKAAIEGFSRSLAIEVASRNITVNTVAPGFIATDMTDELTEDQKSTMLERIPAGRMGEPDDVAGVVCFLVSAQASYITGQTIQVNGGMFAG
ncbi:MAG: 3-oxoacyl-[acyl-carrier-protein] reductase [Pseudomonadota bacterium]|nr:3-oxoacyl-[acyl-carrier-protein] reductase [Pseudomonadota bacterium]